MTTSRLARAHATAGWLTFAAFLATGMLMRLGYPGLEPPDLARDAVRPLPLPARAWPTMLPA